MSPPDLPLYLAPRAEDDFADILQYTLETWGEAQVFAYRAVLDKALLTLQQNPQNSISSSIAQPSKRFMCPVSAWAHGYKVASLSQSAARNRPKPN